MSVDQVVALISNHVERYPAIEVIDVYKLLHQGVFGPGHLLKNQKAVREWLEQESKILEPRSGEAQQESMLESVHPEGAVVRLHLRPYIAAKGDLNKLLHGYLDSSKAITGDNETLKTWWELFQKMTALGGELFSHFEPRTIMLTSRARAAEGWSAAQHSPTFERTYKPAYRVLTRSIAETLLHQQKLTFSIL